jgi:streptogramin lyase
VALVRAGTAYGSIGADLDSTTTDGSGNFTITYVPPSPATLLYVIATGGNAGAGTNSAIALIGVVGLSNEAPGSVKINELTTVAGEWALAQFIDSSGTAIGAPATNATGLANAANQAQVNLADVSTGLPASFWTTYDANAGTCTLVECDVLEPSDALRNLLTDTGELPAPPVNSSCVVLPSVAPPVNCDGLERMDTIANILAACVASSGPSSSACATLLGDTDSTTTAEAAEYMATNLTSSVADLYALQAGSPPFTPALTSAPDGWELALNFSGVDFDAPIALAIDATGNVWVPNFFGDSVTELTSSGEVAGNYDPAGANFDDPVGVAIDAGGNAWMVNQAGESVTELTSSGSLAGNYDPAGANFDNPGDPAIDAAGNVWVPNNVHHGSSITELTSSGDLAGDYAPSGANLSGPAAAAIDATGNVWLPNTFGSTVTALTSSGALAGNYAPTGSDFNVPVAIAIDAGGNAWVANEDGNSIVVLTSSGNLAGNYAPTGANFADPNALAIDSAGNVWVTNQTGNSLTELTSGGDLLGNFAPVGADFDVPTAVAIDAAGDVWIPNSNGDSVAEFIGAAGAVLTPQVACLTQATPAAVCLP